MKSIVRTLAVGLVLAGFISTTYTHRRPVSMTTQFQAKSAAMPIPVCPPNDPNACNIDKWDKW